MTGQISKRNGQTLRSSVNDKRTALVYCRVSTAKQEEEGTSLDSQAAACVTHAEKLGYVVGRITKEVFSGAELFDRPLLSRDRADIRAGQFDAVVVYAIDRLSRDVAHLAILSEEVERAGAALIFVTEDLDDSPEGKLMTSVKAYVAEVERLKIRERCVRGKRQKALNGKVVRGGTDLYGYSYDKEHGIRAIKEDEAMVVRQIYRWILEGVSTRKVIQRLNEQGIPSPARGKRQYKDGRETFWGKGAIGRILSEPAYKGVAVAWRYKGVRGYEDGQKFYRIALRDESEWIQLPDGTTPAIVTAEMWDAVQKALESNRGEETRNETRPDLLRGYVFCGVCGRRMYGESEHGEHRIYRCPSRNTPTGNCGGKRIGAERSEILVWSKITDILRHPETIKLELERRKAEGEDGTTHLLADMESAKKALQNIESELQRLVRRAATADDELWEMFQGQINLKKTERQRLAGLVAETEARIATQNADAISLTALTEYCERVRGNLDNFGFDDKRLALKALNLRVIGNGSEYRLDVSFPISPAAGYSPQSFFS
ncbi:MAG TPA: recombinase family protein [Pyrinomonadaceae bacterium]|jgi:site-specific DNA recombinase|nr:recombinase family protein [Pyrinomonadaceae bacterium]